MAQLCRPDFALFSHEVKLDGRDQEDTVLLLFIWAFTYDFTHFTFDFLIQNYLTVVFTLFSNLFYVFIYSTANERICGPVFAVRPHFVTHRWETTEREPGHFCQRKQVCCLSNSRELLINRATLSFFPIHAVCRIRNRAWSAQARDSRSSAFIEPLEVL